MNYVLSLFLLLSLSYPLCRAAFPFREYCEVGRKASIPVRRNIERVLAALQVNAPSKGFFATSYDFNGRDPVYGVAQCRQDVGAEACRLCLRDGPPQITNFCRGKEDAWLWFDDCFFRYDTKPFAGIFDSDYTVYDYSVKNVTDIAAEQARFAQELRTLLRRVQEQALGKKSLSLGRGERKFSSEVTIYALAQCTRDLPARECSKCVSYVVSFFSGICPYDQDCRAVNSRCYVRFSTRAFFFASKP